MSRRAATSPNPISTCSSCACRRTSRSSSPTSFRAATSPPTSRRTGGLYFGPFRSRASAEKFEGAVPGPVPDAALPGRPGPFARAPRLHLRRNGHVPAAVPVGGGRRGVCPRSRARGGVSAHRMAARCADAIAHSRDRLSEEMQFEEAARQHKRLEKVEDVLKLRDELARDVDRLNGVAITRSLAPFAVEMWFVREGNWQQPQRFGFEVREGKTVSLDHRLRETFAARHAQKAGRPRAPGVSGAAGALVLLQLARRRMAELRRLRRHPLPQAGQRRLAREPPGFWRIMTGTKRFFRPPRPWRNSAAPHLRRQR